MFNTPEKNAPAGQLSTWFFMLEEETLHKLLKAPPT